MKRPLESYPVEVLAEWIRRRGFSYFEEELQGIERRMDFRDSVVAARVNGTRTRARCVIGQGEERAPKSRA